MSKNYFTQETEDAIVAYNTSTDFEERSKIYETKIHYDFFKLTISARLLSRTIPSVVIANVVTIITKNFT